MNERDYETIEDLLPAYALGALDPEDYVRVEGYLAAHPEARRDVEELQETLGTLALSAPRLAPPPGAKAALVARVEQLAAPAPGAEPRPFAVVSPAARPEGVVRPFRGPTAGQNRRGRGWRTALAAVAAAIILGLTGWNVALQRQVATVQNQVVDLQTKIDDSAGEVALGHLVGDQTFARPLSSVAADDNPYSSSGGPSGYLYSDPAGKVGLLNCYWMPIIDKDHVYQIWLVRADGTRDSGGTFTVDARGNASVVINARHDFSTYTSVGVTAEPKGGSPGPTTPRVVWTNLD